jgi:phosphate transport system permease protein
MPSAPNQSPVSDRPKGEPLVWLSAAGLAVALIMVLGLIGLIFWQGISVFWPKQVVELQLRDEATSGVGRSTVLAGVLIRKDDNAKLGRPEWRMFVGNRNFYGLSFTYVDSAEIEAVHRPDDIVVAERMESGNAIFTPLRLELAEGPPIPFGDPRFWPETRRLLKEVNERRAEIFQLERHQIGRINHEVTQLNVQRRALERDLGSEAAAATEQWARIGERLAELDGTFQQLAAKARELRALQSRERLHFVLPTGGEHVQPMGDFVGMHQPNQMGLLAKIGHFISQFWSFLSERPREANTEGGIFPAIFGTFVMTVLMSAAVMPFGVLAAIYLREYAHQGAFTRSVRIAVNNLAGVPSIVYGVFGLGFFVYFIGGSLDRLFFDDRLPTATFGTGGILWASLTLALMTVPVVIVATEEALAAVPRGAREASLACGASKWQTIQRIVLPASAPGILTGLILAMARGAGEVAPLMMVGVVKLAPSLPIDGTFPFIHLERKFMHLGFHIYDLGFQSPDSEAARPMVFATTFLLILLVVVLNLGAILIRNHLRKKYDISTF